MSPEQVRGQPADHRSDIFALGAILYEMLTGRRPFARESTVETMSAILRDDAPPIHGIDVTQSAALNRIVTHCLEKAPEARFQSARDLAFGLETLSGVSAVTPQLEPAAVRMPRSMWGVSAVIVALTALAVWSVWMIGRMRDSSQAARGAAATAVPFLASDAIEKQPSWIPQGI